MATYDIESFYQGLVDHGLIVPVRVPGAFGRGAVFEDVLERFNAAVTALSKNDGAEVYTFPPVIDPKAPPLRSERHIPNSIATLRRRLIIALIEHLPRCPCCGAQKMTRSKLNL